MVKYRAVAVAVAVAVSGGGAVAVAVAGLTKRFFNHIQKDFLINVWTVGGIITILGMQAEVAIQSRAATSGSIIISTHHYLHGNSSL